MSLTDIGQKFTIYTGIFLIITGLVGNGINILVFSSIRSYRTTPCTFYFLMGSIANIIYITVNLIARVVVAGTGFDLTRTSVVWCKTRTFSSYTFNVISLTCSCLATIDHFFATSQNAKLRGLSNIKLAYRLVFIVIIIWCLHGIAPILSCNISPITQSCVITNAGYQLYTSVYAFGFVLTLPVVTMITFGYLTYRNIHLTRVLAQQQADRQLTQMILIQVVLVLVSIVPYGIYHVYNQITSGMSKDVNRLQIESFISTILSNLAFAYLTVCFIHLKKLFIINCCFPRKLVICF
jgi:hypothetical protein